MWFLDFIQVNLGFVNALLSFLMEHITSVTLQLLFCGSSVFIEILGNI